MTHPPTDQIRLWLEDIFAESDFEQVFLVELKVSPESGRIAVFIDADEGVDFDLCRRISRRLEEQLDESLLLGERYTLEVSSPGVSRPLKVLRQFKKHVGRKLKVKLSSEEASGETRASDETLEGRLELVDEHGIVLSGEHVMRDERGKRRKEAFTKRLAHDTFSDAVVQVDFSKPPKAPRK